MKKANERISFRLKEKSVRYSFKDNLLYCGRETIGKKLIYTPNSNIRAALRQLFLRSRERANALKRDKYTCQECHRKQSKAKGKEFKVQVHHKDGILNWDKLFSAVREYLLCNPDLLETLCEECHEEKTKGEK